MAKISFGEIPTKVKGFGAVLALGATAFGLSGCGGSAEANGPSPTPTSIESVEPTPTEEPTETTPTAAETGFQGIIDYAAFENWETLTDSQKTSVLMQFLDINPPATDVVPSPEMNAIDVAEWFKAVTDEVFAIATDKTNPENLAVALKLGETLSRDYADEELGPDGSDGARGTMYESIRGAAYNTFDTPMVLNTIDPEKVRVSTGFFQTHPENLAVNYTATIIKGNSVAIANQELSQIYQLAQSPDGEYYVALILSTTNTTGDQVPEGAPPLQPPIG